MRLLPSSGAAHSVSLTPAGERARFCASFWSFFRSIGHSRNGWSRSSPGNQNAQFTTRPSSVMRGGDFGEPVALRYATRAIPVPMRATRSVAKTHPTCTAACMVACELWMG